MFTSSLRSHKLKSGNISGKIRHCVTRNEIGSGTYILVIFQNVPHQNTSTTTVNTNATNNTTTTGSSNDTKEQLVLFTKLFLIMGLSWLSECIHIELHGDHSDLHHCNFYFEVFLRFIGGLNMIRGFFIFMVFICKPKIWTLAANRHPKLWRFFGFFKFSTCCDYHQEGAEENSRISVKFEPRKGTNLRLVPLQTQSEGGGNPALLIESHDSNGTRRSSDRLTYLSDLSKVN